MNSSQNTLALQPNDSIEAFIGLMRDIGQQLRACAEMLARLVHHDPQAIEKIREAAPAASPGFLSNLLRVGEGALHPDLLTNNCAAYSRLRMLPYSAQESLLRSGSVDVVIDAQTGDTIKVPLVELGGEQLSQAISQTGARPAADQQAWLRRRTIAKVKSQPRVAAMPWIVKKDKVWIGDVELSQKDLLRILEEMTA